LLNTMLWLNFNMNISSTIRTVCILRIKCNLLYDWELAFVVNAGRPSCESISIKVCILKYRVCGPDVW
jgi:hypothetical protein